MILGAYFLLSVGRLESRSPAFQWMNVAGALGFIVNSGWHGAIPSTALNVVWLLIGGFALWRIFRGSDQSRAEPGRDDRSL